ncbi:AraC family transcriptional regulator [Escherichia coli]|nr:AraC family transcriptional regulator [Escherichia coli]
MIRFIKFQKKIGISSTSYFIKHFKNHFGITPKQYLIYFRS